MSLLPLTKKSNRGELQKNPNQPLHQTSRWALYWQVSRIEIWPPSLLLVKNQLWHKDQRIDHEGDAIIMSLPVADDRELIMKIMQYGAQARVLAPVELAMKIKDEARRMLQAYDAAEAR
jgi:predicted DNA-binding transcriptional regulator YafY